MGQNIIKSTKSKMYSVLYTHTHTHTHIYIYIYMYSNIDFDNYDRC